MKFYVFSVVLISVVLVCDVTSLKCAPNACATVRCSSPPSKCPEGTILKPSGHCLCCQSCKKILYEGGDCTPERPIAGATSDKVVCADGLRCQNNVCRKIKV